MAVPERRSEDQLDQEEVFEYLIKNVFTDAFTGGGRIAVYASGLTGFTGTLSARGGMGPAFANYGGPGMSFEIMKFVLNCGLLGTIYKQDTSTNFNSLTVDNGVNSHDNGWLAEIIDPVLTQFNFSELTVSGGAEIVLANTTTVSIQH